MISATALISNNWVVAGTCSVVTVIIPCFAGSDARKPSKILLLSQWSAAELTGTDMFCVFCTFFTSQCWLMTRMMFCAFTCDVDGPGDEPE